MHAVQIQVREFIVGPPEPIFAWLSAHEEYKRFPGFIASKLVRHGDIDPNGVGARREMWFNGTRVVEDILIFEPPLRLGYRVVHCSIPLKHELGVIELVPSANGTEVTWTTSFDVAVPVIGPLIGRLTQPGLTKAIGKILGFVKRQVESGVAPRVLPPSAAQAVVRTATDAQL